MQSQSQTESLYSLLHGMRPDKGVKATHVSQQQQRSYYIPPESLYLFYKLYCSIVQDRERVSVSEIATTPTPFRIDLDIYYATDLYESQGVGLDSLAHGYTREQIQELVVVCQKEIADTVAPGTPSSCLDCIVLGKRSARKVDKDGEYRYKDGLHLHFPHLCLENWVFAHLTKRIDDAVVDLGVFGDALFQDVTFDRNVETKPWLMYGSSKSVSEEPYLIHCCIDGDGEACEVRDIFRSEYDAIKVSAGKGKKPEPIDYHLPKLMSIRSCEQSTPISAKLRGNKREISIRGKKVQRKRSEVDVAQDLALIRSHGLLNMLSDHRADDRDAWMDVGWTLFCIGEGCEEALDLWVGFSERNDKFQQGECDRLWQDMEMRGKTMGSLFFMIEQDSPEAWAEWKHNMTSSKISDSLKLTRCTEGKFSEILYEMLKDKWAFAETEQGKGWWYEFRGHRWHKDKGDMRLQRIIRYELKEKLLSYQDALRSSFGEDKEDQTRKTKQDSILIKALESLESDGMVTRTIKMSKCLFYREEFVERLDSDRWLVGCENGVLDLKNMVHRPGRPEDYISKSTGQWYHEYTQNDPAVQQTKAMLRKVFPNRNKLQFFLDVWSMGLTGLNSQKMFIVATGPPNAGKSAIFKVMRKALGGYCINSPAELIQKGNRNASSSARPELKRLAKVRAQIFSEISDHKTIDVDEVKRQTGNDDGWSRGLYDGEGGEEEPMHTTFMQCNKPPVMGSDDALWVRIKCLEMDSQFMLRAEDAPETEQEQWRQLTFPADLNYKEKIPVYAPVVLWLLFKNVDRIRKGVLVPKIVIHDTTTHKHANDIFYKFQQDKLREEAGGSILVSDLFTEFRAWISTNYPSLRPIPIKDKFVRELSVKIGTPIRGRKLDGWKIINDLSAEQPAEEMQLGEEEELVGW